MYYSESDLSVAMPVNEALSRYPILKHFRCSHLPEPLKERSYKFQVLAWDMAMNSPHDPETSAGLRKILEAKDCFVRAIIPNK